MISANIVKRKRNGRRSQWPENDSCVLNHNRGWSMPERHWYITKDILVFQATDFVRF
jgi:hypothetical protein